MRCSKPFREVTVIMTSWWRTVGGGVSGSSEDSDLEDELVER